MNNNVFSIICMCLTAVTCFTILIIQSKAKVKKEKRIASKARLNHPEILEQPPIFIKTTNYKTIPLMINHILPDIREETIKLAMEFCEHELLKNAAKSIDYKIRDCSIGSGRELTATLLIANSQSSRDADC